MDDFIPVNEPLLTGNEAKYLQQCIETGWISSEGSFVAALEEGIAEYVGRAYGIAVANGSVALDLAIEALGLTKGDEVIVPTFTIISCIAPLIRRGIVPVLVDCNPFTYTLRPEDIEALITSRTKAIMAVHIYGLPVDMDPVCALAKKHNLRIIEDAAEALGLAYRSRRCGSIGDISTLSFYPNKHVTTGEGGMVLTDDEALAARCRSMRNLCFDDTRRFVHEELGFNYRMSNLQAAVGCAQLEQLESFLRQKREMGALYTQLLESYESYLQLPLKDVGYARNNYWVYPLVLRETVPENAREFMKRLGNHGIGTRPFFYPMHKQPVFRSRGLFEGIHLPHAEHIAEYGFYLPSGMALTDTEQNRVADAVGEVLAELGCQRAQ